MRGLVDGCDPAVTGKEDNQGTRNGKILEPWIERDRGIYGMEKSSRGRTTLPFVVPNVG